MLLLQEGGNADKDKKRKMRWMPKRKVFETKKEENPEKGGRERKKTMDNRKKKYITSR